MEAIELVIRFIVGGALITAVSVIGRTEYGFLSGLVVLFPIVTFIGYFFVSMDVSNEMMKDIVLFSIITVPTVWGFTVGVYISMEYVPMYMSLLFGVLCWGIMAFTIVLLDMTMLELVVVDNA